MEIHGLAVSMFETNCYLAYDGTAGEGIIIDPGDEADRIAAEIERLRFRPTVILLTHGHGDHIGGVAELKERYGIPMYAGRGAEATVVLSNQNFPAMFGVSVFCPEPDRLLAEGEKVSFGNEALAVIHTPGHSPGGVCFQSGKVLFCGDTLFCNSVGRTDLPGSNHDHLIASIRQKLLVLPDDTICYPGHGPTTTIGQERRYNPFITGKYFE